MDQQGLDGAAFQERGRIDEPRRPAPAGLVLIQAVARDCLSTPVAEAPKSWFVVHTKSHQQGLCLETLERKGFPVFMPVKTVRKLRSRKMQTITQPLFERYVFVALDSAAPAFSVVRKSLGVEWLIQNGNTPVRIRNTVIEALQVAEEAGVFDETKPKPVDPADVIVKLKPGDSVRIIDGPCADLIAEIIAMPSDRRIELLLHKAGHRAKVIVPLANIEKSA